MKQSHETPHRRPSALSRLARMDTGASHDVEEFAASNDVANGSSDAIGFLGPSRGAAVVARVSPVKGKSRRPQDPTALHVVDLAIFSYKKGGNDVKDMNISRHAPERGIRTQTTNLSPARALGSSSAPSSAGAREQLPSMDDDSGADSDGGGPKPHSSIRKLGAAKRKAARHALIPDGISRRSLGELKNEPGSLYRPDPNQVSRAGKVIKGKKVEGWTSARSRKRVAGGSEKDDVVTVEEAEDARVWDQSRPHGGGNGTRSGRAGMQVGAGAGKRPARAAATKAASAISKRGDDEDEDELEDEVDEPPKKKSKPAVKRLTRQQREDTAAHYRNDAALAVELADSGEEEDDFGDDYEGNSDDEDGEGGGPTRKRKNLVTRSKVRSGEAIIVDDEDEDGDEVVLVPLDGQASQRPDEEAAAAAAAEMAKGSVCLKHLPNKDKIKFAALWKFAHNVRENLAGMAAQGSVSVSESGDAAGGSSASGEAPVHGLSSASSGDAAIVTASRLQSVLGWGVVNASALTQSGGVGPSRAAGKGASSSSSSSSLNLTPYQLVGLNWMLLLHRAQVNGVLADEMGLGKSVQTIGLLAWLASGAEEGLVGGGGGAGAGPFLIVTPASTVGNWVREIRKWSPALRVGTYRGGADRAGQQRALVTGVGLDEQIRAATEAAPQGSPKESPRSSDASEEAVEVHSESSGDQEEEEEEEEEEESEMEVDSEEDRKAQPTEDAARAFDVLITTYTLFDKQGPVATTDRCFLRRFAWQYLICDEGHNLKNAAGQRFGALASLVTKHRLLLTGTPIQNTLPELFALLRFLQPTLFTKRAESLFTESCAGGGSSSRKSAGVLADLRRVVGPFILRRAKADVLADLPAKTEGVCTLLLPPVHAAVYAAVMEEARDVLGMKKKEKEGKKGAGRGIQLDEDEAMGEDGGMRPIRAAARAAVVGIAAAQLIERQPMRSLAGAGTGSASAPPATGAVRVKLQQASTHGAGGEAGGASNRPISAYFGRAGARPVSMIDLDQTGDDMQDDPIDDDGVSVVVARAGARSVGVFPDATMTSPLGGGMGGVINLIDSPQPTPISLRDSPVRPLLFPAGLAEGQGASIGGSSSAAAAAAPLVVASLMRDGGHDGDAPKSGKGKGKRVMAGVFGELRRASQHPLMLRVWYTHGPTIARLAEALASAGAFGKDAAARPDSERVREHVLSLSDYAIWELARECGNAHYEAGGVPGVEDGTQCTVQPIVAPAGMSGRRLLVHCALALPPWTLYCSAKLTWLSTFLPPALEAGHRVLFFSQLMDVLSIAGHVLSGWGVRWQRLDGSTPVPERQRLIDSFNGDASLSVFLVSTKAGGLGLNLTAADTVIIHDSDWNPHADAQAVDRAHRLGQTRPVTVHRLVAAGTLDEKISAVAAAKLDLDRALRGGPGSDTPVKGKGKGGGSKGKGELDIERLLHEALA